MQFYYLYYLAVHICACAHAPPGLSGSPWARVGVALQQDRDRALGLALLLALASSTSNRILFLLGAKRLLLGAKRLLLGRLLLGAKRLL